MVIYVKDKKLKNKVYKMLGKLDNLAIECYESGDFKKGKEYEKKSDKLYKKYYNKIFGVR